MATAPDTAGANDRAGLAALIAGIAIIAGSLGSALIEWAWILMLIGFAGLIYGIPGLHAYQASADGAPGRWGAQLIRWGGAVVVLLGIMFLVWEAVGDAPEDGTPVVDVLWMVGFFAFAIGMVLFTVGTIRAKVLPQAAAILMVVGLVGAIAIDMATGAFFGDDAGTTEWGFYIGVPVFGLGLAWLGYTVWKTSTGSTRTAGAHPSA